MLPLETQRKSPGAQELATAIHAYHIAGGSKRFKTGGFANLVWPVVGDLYTLVVHQDDFYTNVVKIDPHKDQHVTVRVRVYIAHLRNEEDMPLIFTPFATTGDLPIFAVWADVCLGSSCTDRYCALTLCIVDHRAHVVEHGGHTEIMLNTRGNVVRRTVKVAVDPGAAYGLRTRQSLLEPHVTVTREVMVPNDPPGMYESLSRSLPKLGPWLSSLIRQ